MTSLPQRALRLPPLPTVRDLVKLYRLNAIKQLSQNFLFDERVIAKLVKSAGKIEGCHVCEVGPGPGGITREILARGAKSVILIEKDKRFARPLKVLDISCPGKIKVFWGDVLSFNVAHVFPAEAQTTWQNDMLPPLHVIGNLPFSVSTPLVIRWLKDISLKSNAWEFGRVPLTLTFQKEVADRIVSDTLDSQRSRLSIMSQYLCHCKKKFTISGKAFVPKPDVDVSVVQLIPRKQPLISHPFDLVEKVVRQTFSMRQKYCSRGISTLFPAEVRQEFTKQMFLLSEIDPHTRPMELTIDEFGRLCDAYAEICQKNPSFRDYNYRGIKPDETWNSLYLNQYLVDPDWKIAPENFEVSVNKN